MALETNKNKDNTEIDGIATRIQFIWLWIFAIEFLILKVECTRRTLELKLKYRLFFFAAQLECAVMQLATHNMNEYRLEYTNGCNSSTEEEAKK